MSYVKRLAAAFVVSSLAGGALAACSSDSGSNASDAGGLPDVGVHGDGGHDATAGDASHDGGVDATSDGGVDAGNDGANEAASDAGTDADAASDAAHEAASDAASDADAANDAGADATDAATDADAANDAPSDAPADAAGDASDAAFVPPTCDGVVASGEYGVHTDGQNQQTSGGQAWFATWDDTKLYLALTGANTAEGSIVYVSTSPNVGIDAGTNLDGTLVVFTYDAEKIASLPFHAMVASYVKASYDEVRNADGAGGWGNAIAGQLTVCTNGTTREYAIPWTMITGGARPASFAFVALATSGGGFVYGQVPTDDPGGAIGTSATYSYYYLVANTTPVTGDKPFATKLQR